MARRHYSSNARETTLTAGVTSSATTISLDSPAGYPAETPFVILCELGTSSEEIMLVTAMVGDQWTVTRGYDSSTAVAHDLGAKIVHGVAAIDMDEANEHVNTSADVHGLSGGASVVGTTSSQTLTNKTLTSPTINGGTLNSVTLGAGLTLDTPTLNTPTIANYTNAQHTHEDAASGGVVGGGDSSVAYKRTGSGTVNININENGNSGTALTLGTLSYSVGNSTWSTASSNSRIVLPTDIVDGVWAISAGCHVTGGGENLFIVIEHEDLGVIARNSSFQDSLSGAGFHQMCVATDFQSSAGKWVQFELGCPTASLGSVSYSNAYVAIHRVA